MWKCAINQEEDGNDITTIVLSTFYLNKYCYAISASGKYNLRFNIRTRKVFSKNCMEV